MISAELPFYALIKIWYRQSFRDPLHPWPFLVSSLPLHAYYKHNHLFAFLGELWGICSRKCFSLPRFSHSRTPLPTPTPNPASPRVPRTHDKKSHLETFSGLQPGAGCPAWGRGSDPTLRFSCCASERSGNWEWRDCEARTVA